MLQKAISPSELGRYRRAQARFHSKATFAASYQKRLVKAMAKSGHTALRDVGILLGHAADQRKCESLSLQGLHHENDPEE